MVSTMVSKWCERISSIHSRNPPDYAAGFPSLPFRGPEIHGDHLLGPGPKMGPSKDSCLSPPEKKKKHPVYSDRFPIKPTGFAFWFKKTCSFQPMEVQSSDSVHSPGATSHLVHHLRGELGGDRRHSHGGFGGFRGIRVRLGDRGARKLS